MIALNQDNTLQQQIYQMSVNRQVWFWMGLIALGVISLLFSPEALAMSMDHDTAMKDALKGLEDTLTGGWARTIAIGSIIVGFVMSLMQSSPQPIFLACIVVVIAKLVLKYADSSYTLLI